MGVGEHHYDTKCISFRDLEKDRQTDIPEN